jgi:hypothetical protein
MENWHHSAMTAIAYVHAYIDDSECALGLLLVYKEA